MTADRSTLPPGAERRGQGSHGVTTGGTRIVLATSDPVFAAQCQRALEGTNQQLLATVSLAELVRPGGSRA
jgi:hypothetical protein